MLTLKRKLFFLGSGNYRMGASQIFKGLTNKSIMNGNLQNMTGRQRFGSVMKGFGNLGKGAIKTTVGVGGTALAVGGLGAMALKNAATDG